VIHLVLTSLSNNNGRINIRQLGEQIVVIRSDYFGHYSIMGFLHQLENSRDYLGIRVMGRKSIYYEWRRRYILLGTE
jgi:hypothetical protein